MPPPLPPSWRAVIGPEFAKPYFHGLQHFLDEERKTATVYPPAADVYSAFHLTPFDAVRVVVLGQDPYHGPGQAHGLAFSVRPGVKSPPSLANIFRELKSDTGIDVPKNQGCLIPWAEQGVLLLNTVLTVRAGEANSHRNQGWETFTDAVIRTIGGRKTPAVFVLWGAPAKKKSALIDLDRHAVVSSAHPSPLSARNGFFGSRPFSQINSALRRLKQPEIDWTLAPAE